MFDIDAFVNLMGQLEGTVEHQGLEQSGNKITYPYGITCDTAKRFGVAYPSGCYDGLANATAVYKKMLANFKRENPNIKIDFLHRNTAFAIFSLYINLGSFSKVPTLKGHLETGAMDEAMSALLQIHNVTLQGKTYSSKGLVVRRAKEWNMMSKALGASDKIVQVNVQGSRDKPEFRLAVKDSPRSNILVLAKFPLHPDNSLRPIGV